MHGLQLIGRHFDKATLYRLENTNGGSPVALAVAGMGNETLVIVTREVLHGSSAYRKGDGYEVPEACRLFWGVR